MFSECCCPLINCERHCALLGRCSGCRWPSTIIGRPEQPIYFHCQLCCSQVRLIRCVL